MVYIGQDKMEKLRRNTKIDKFLIISFSFFLIVNFTPNFVSSSDNVSIISISPQFQKVSIGETFFVNITVDPVEAIAGIQFDILFNSSLLTANKVTYGGIFGSNYFFLNGSINNENGSIKRIACIMVPTNNGTMNAGNVAVIEFTAIKDGWSNINLTNVLIGAPDGYAVPITIQNTSIEIRKKYTYVNVVSSKEVISQKERFTVNITIDPSEEIVSAEIDLLFDPSIIKVIDVKNGGMFDMWFEGELKIDNENGSITNMVALNLFGNVTSIPGTFAIITFESNRTNGLSYLNLSDVKIWNKAVQKVPVLIKNSSIEVSVKYTSIDVKTIQKVSIGETFFVNITVDPVEAIAGIQFDILFNSSLLTANKVTYGGIFGSNYFFLNGSINNENGSIKRIACIMVPTNNGTMNAGNVAVIEFTAIKDGWSNINLTNVLIGAPDGYAVPITIQNTSIEILYKYSIYLSKGWNLITIPVKNNFTAETLGQCIGTCDTIAAWNATLQQYVVHPIGTGINDFEIEDGIAYFIHVTDNVTFNITGELLQNVTVSIKPGWNMIGWIGNSINAEQFASEIIGCDTVVKWETTTQQFIPHPVGTMIQNFEISRGMGLFIHASQESQWHYGV